MDSASSINANGLQNQIDGAMISSQSQNKLKKQHSPLGINHKISLTSTKTADTIEENKEHHEALLICKICLAEIDSQKQKRQQLISPCACTGSMKHVHQECLRSWLNAIVTKNLQKNNNTYRISCQICKQPYNYDIYHRLQCLNKEEFKDKVSEKKLFTIMVLFFAIFCIGGIFALAYLTFAGKIVNKSTLTTNYSVLAAFGSILLVLLALSILVFAWVCLIKRVGLIKQIKPRQEPIVQRVPYSSRQQPGL